MELKFEKEIGFCLQSFLNGCLSVGARRVWARSGWRSWVTLAICYLLSPNHLSSSAQPNYTDQDCQVHSGLDCGQLSRHQTLDPGFSGSKTAGTRAGAAPDSGVTMVIMNTRAGEEREARSVWPAARAAPLSSATKPLLFDCSQKAVRHKYGPCTAQPGPHPTYSQLPLRPRHYIKVSSSRCATFHSYCTQWGESAKCKEVKMWRLLTFWTVKDFGANVDQW